MLNEPKLQDLISKISDKDLIDFLNPFDLLNYGNNFSEFCQKIYDCFEGEISKNDLIKLSERTLLYEIAKRFAKDLDAFVRRKF